MLQQVLSYQIADSIDIRTFKSVFKSELYFSDTDELFYITGEGNIFMCLNTVWFVF